MTGEKIDYNKRGCVHIYYGENKGKTTCAIGLAIRAVGFNRRVAFVQFDKGYEGDEHYHERKIIRDIDKITFLPTGKERMLPDGSFRFDNTEADKQEARKGLAYVENAVRDGRYFLVIADEILTTLEAGLLEEKDILKLLDIYEKKPVSELVLTGRMITDAIAEHAQLITEMRKVKHYFDLGRKAKEGIEF